MAHSLNLLSSGVSKFTSQLGVRVKEGMIIGKSKKLQKEHLTWTGTDRKQPLLWRSTRWGETSYMLPVRSRHVEEQREKKTHPVCWAVRARDLFFITRGWVAILEFEHGSQTAELWPQVSQILARSQMLQCGTDSTFTAMLHFPLLSCHTAMLHFPLLSCLRFIFKLFFGQASAFRSHSNSENRSSLLIQWTSISVLKCMLVWLELIDWKNRAIPVEPNVSTHARFASGCGNFGC